MVARECFETATQQEVCTRHFSFRPTLTFRGRKFLGLRGFSGKPLHPPLSDVPMGAYVIAAGLDVISFVGAHTAWQSEFYKAATFNLIAGAAVSIGAVVTGAWDRWRSSEAGTQARRTINSHAILMLLMTALVLVDLGLRIFLYYGRPGPTPSVLVLSVAAALVGALGATYGGTLVFGYGFNVETGGDHPVWHRSERDVFPGEATRAEASLEALTHE